MHESKDKINKLAKLDQDNFKKEQSDILVHLNEFSQFLDSKRDVSISTSLSFCFRLKYF